MSFFSKKQTPAELMREQNKILRRAQRDVEKDRRDLERQEKQLEMEIKKAAKQGNKEVCAVLAKNLIQVRKQKARTYTASSKIQSIGSQTKSMHSSSKLANTMATTTKTMGAVNREMNPQGIMKTMQDFEKESMKMGMTEEIVEDSLNAVLDESGDEEEQDAVVNQVLDEIGIEISGKMAEAPSAHRGELGESSKIKFPTDEELEKQLAQLRT
ncbi:charged multivesicular body protein 2b-like [Stegodyphus dumicola]|uniref:charged multivesicular body protein 2b-like n=1 Tax=Stegodyphus dumicola TaxID=202533 RepID=UPI0015A78298|nr:charged multivesicular body protein 2b-like [Stegodyphus dumicola]